MNNVQKLIKRYCEENNLTITSWATYDVEQKKIVTVPANAELPEHPNSAAIAYTNDTVITQIRTCTALARRDLETPCGLRMYATVNGKEKAVKWRR